MYLYCLFYNIIPVDIPTVILNYTMKHVVEKLCNGSIFVYLISLSGFDTDGWSITKSSKNS